jgi:Flp pilus assembly protein TadG
MEFAKRRATGRRRWSFLRDIRGAAALETVLWLPIVALPALNVVDLGFYAYQRMQLDNAAQAGVQNAWKTCYAYTSQPKGTACGAAMTTAITSGIQSTSLGANVTVVAGSPTEGAYCPDSSNVLQPVGSYKMSCAAAGYPAGTAGDYLQLSVRYTYTPLFAAASLASALPTPIMRTAWMRLG